MLLSLRLLWHIASATGSLHPSSLRKCQSSITHCPDNTTIASATNPIGQTSHPTDSSRNAVTITWAAANHDNTGQSLDNVYTSVLVVSPTFEASLTGSGPSGSAVPEDTPFGNRDFRVYHVDFRNLWSEFSDGPAHALSFSRANGGFYYCGFYSYQDTVYIGKLANAYFFHSVLAGQTDFIYGFGTAWIQSSALQLRGCGGGITAWKGSNTTFENRYGVYIVDSQVRAANASLAARINGACALGRPWNSQHRSIFARSFEDGSIDPAGTGDVTTVMDAKAFAPYREPAGVFQGPEGRFGDVSWIDWETVRA
ncbi:hypothetical protein N7492_007663 [Penicillium capsulatum]|uniref:pectinesterase n=1 Tax=Penicillium capsulatum TaxID=69766 RepID=A0A9W9LMA1_9EURO|nr:hypothetical protein N7492_007663 [Penicillium capsulatum]KAJ6117497.1 hypothetical protein N7512_007222 [Penicillium capsulatum]